ncbi:uncharacterized protein LOC128127223 [Lactuca sativa]|uniref:uncharacterized protein LOC128127223 n=1 Tax=Lactuca sativa TaxID=4236 RepID=UPI0022AFBB75|nr:uncharacterized protein LOC128127223 [Lactuca sativa]
MSETPLLTPDIDVESVDQTHYRSMIGLLMYLTTSRPDIMFAVCQYIRYPDNPKFSHLIAVKKKFFGGCQYLGDRLVSWQCKKQHTVSTSTTEAEYVDASACCSQLIWIQHQLLDYDQMAGLKFADMHNLAIVLADPSVAHGEFKSMTHGLKECCLASAITMNTVVYQNIIREF